ncbi:hypothetical protein CFIMG_006032RA [Ceratocystis fimbriata CBS 114723]|uniref:PHD-type domain-containing protein n=1 Tax=Ceratocystis fimbriata CBS 114723 TaxID=1035309 RepID=A0A2C5X361_9PEZI|nr:hypothetical protein CFIMG_006032RA [Ceratocystis fimbriata CBS 114723]
MSVTRSSSLATDGGSLTMYAERGLRIHITRIVATSGPSHALDNPLPAPSTPIESIKAQVKLRILDCSSEKPEELITKPLECLVLTHQSKDTAAQKEPENMTVQLGKIFIPEKELSTFLPSGSFGLCRRYRLDVYISASCSNIWPPAGILSGDSSRASNPKRFSFIASRIDLFSRGLQHRTMYGYDCERPAAKTQYRLEVDLQWSLSSVRPVAPSGNITVPPSLAMSGLHAEAHGLTEPKSVSLDDRDAARRASSSEEATSTFQATATDSGSDPDPDPDSFQHVPHIGHLTQDVYMNHESSCDSEEPSQRRLRERKQISTYNLKQLSSWRFYESTLTTSDSNSIVASKPKRPQKTPAIGTGMVKYYFDHCWVSRDRFRCLPCGNPHMSLDSLLQHLQSSHKNVEFHLNTQSKLKETLDSDSGTPPKIYIRPLPRLLDESAQHKASLLTNPGFITPMTHVEPLSLPPEALETFTVPKNGFPMYDHITHKELTPGTQHIQHRLDKSWLIHRHQCALNDYTDITGAEKAYIIAWSTYSLAHDTTRATVACVWLSFLHDHLAWLISSRDLMYQVMHHASTLTACDVLDMDTHDAALRLVQQAWDSWTAKTVGMTPKQECRALDDAAMLNPVSAAHSPQPTLLCTVCATQILAGAWVVRCVGSLCNKEFHGRCLKEKGERGLFSQMWRCDECKKV